MAERTFETVDAALARFAEIDQEYADVLSGFEGADDVLDLIGIVNMLKRQLGHDEPAEPEPEDDSLKLYAVTARTRYMLYAHSRDEAITAAVEASEGVDTGEGVFVEIAYEHDAQAEDVGEDYGTGSFPAERKWHATLCAVCTED